MHRRLAVLLVALAAAACAPASAAAAPVRSDVRAIAKATLAFDLTHGNAIGRAERRGDANRLAAQSCFATLQAAPAAVRPSLLTMYVTFVGSGYFAEDEPIFARWNRALARVPTRDATLRRARASIASQLRVARSLYGYGKDFCGPVLRWQGARWAEARAPAVLRRQRAINAMRPQTRGLNAAALLLRDRGGAGGQLAGSALVDGIGEPDEILIEGDDPIVAVLAPSP